MRRSCIMVIAVGSGFGKSMWFGLVWFGGISTIVGYLKAKSSSISNNSV